MKTVESILVEEKRLLEKVVKEARKRNETAPEGHLRIKKKRDNVEYYFKSASDNKKIVEKQSINSSSAKASNNNSNKADNSNKSSSSSNGRYMKKSEQSVAQRIAQRDYDVNVIKRAEERIKAIETFLKSYEKTSLKVLYQKTNPYRRELISASILSDEEYVRRWQEVEYKGKAFGDDENEIITERGERVRSKSEKIIADKLYALGIPYRYEYPLALEGNIKVYPDFTILRMPDRKEVYLEHLGMMGDANYVESVMYKLSTYEKNGIYLGWNLFVTYETGKKPLNTRVLDSLIRKVFCVE